jgi:hypothetical protein
MVQANGSGEGLMNGISYIVYLISYIVYHISYTVYLISYIVYNTWYMIHDTWYMIHDTWYTIHDTIWYTIYRISYHVPYSNMTSDVYPGVYNNLHEYYFVFFCFAFLSYDLLRIILRWGILCMESSEFYFHLIPV